MDRLRGSLSKNTLIPMLKLGFGSSRNDDDTRRLGDVESLSYDTNNETNFILGVNSGGGNPKSRASSFSEFKKDSNVHPMDRSLAAAAKHTHPSSSAARKLFKSDESILGASTKLTSEKYRRVGSQPTVRTYATDDLVRNQFPPGRGDSKNYTKKLLLSHVGFRLSRRKELHAKRRKIADYMLVLGAFGILLMIIFVELNTVLEYESYNQNLAAQQQQKIQNSNLKISVNSLNSSKDSRPFVAQMIFIIKCLISMSTLILLSLIFVYHRLDMRLYCIDNSIEDWRIAITTARISQIILEFVVCLIHPYPSNVYNEFKKNPSQSAKGFNNSNGINMLNLNNFYKNLIVSPENQFDSIMPVPTTIYLSIPMFARLYLFGRVLLLHSKLVTDASSQSLGYLNRISFNFKFVFKTYMSMNPEFVLAILICALFLIASWSLKACEYHPESDKFGFLNSAWLVAITFLTVGYGDLYPNTYCGRTIAVLCGLFGVFCTALLVAVITKKLEFSRAEKYVYQFVTEIEMVKQLKTSAANILKQGWMLYKLRKLDKREESLKEQELIVRQRKLLMSIQKIRSLKHEQRKLYDNAVTTLELYRQNQEALSTIQSLAKVSTNLEHKLNMIESRFKIFDMEMKNLSGLLSNISQKA